VSRPELAILVGLPGAGKTTFFETRLAATHVHVSKDRLKSARDKQARQMALVEEALAAGRSVAVDNQNATARDRTVLIEAARRHDASVVAYALDTPPRLCVERNASRTGRARVPTVAIFAAAKRFESPSITERFDRLFAVHAEDGRFDVAPALAPETVFLLSPASTSGARARLLLNDRATFPLARALHSTTGAPLGDLFAFSSSLYFRGKLAYARAFARPPADLCGAFVITPCEGLRDPAEPVTLKRLLRWVDVPIKLTEPRYLEPLVRDATALRRLAGPACRVVLLGSVASTRYVEPLLDVFGERLMFPAAFVGRGDMSRGGLCLRFVEQGEELEYTPVAGAARHGARPPKLPPKRR
jgi:predicted kinase